MAEIVLLAVLHNLNLKSSKIESQQHARIKSKLRGAVTERRVFITELGQNDLCSSQNGHSL